MVFDRTLPIVEGFAVSVRVGIRIVLVDALDGESAFVTFLEADAHRVGCNVSPVFDTPDAVARLRLAANQKSSISGDVERRYELTTDPIKH
jgi:hypothetical protein